MEKLNAAGTVNEGEATENCQDLVRFTRMDLTYNTMNGEAGTFKLKPLKSAHIFCLLLFTYTKVCMYII